MTAVKRTVEASWMVRVGEDAPFEAAATETALELICGRIMGHAVRVTEKDGDRHWTQDQHWLPLVKTKGLIEMAYTMAQLKVLEAVRRAIDNASIPVWADKAIYKIGEQRPRLGLGDRHGLHAFVLLQITTEPWRARPTVVVVHKQDAEDNPLFKSDDPTAAGVFMAMRMHERHVRKRVSMLENHQMHQSHKIRPNLLLVDPWTVHLKPTGRA